MRLLYGRMAASVWAEAVTVLAEYGFVFSAQFLCHRLLDKTVDCSWDSQRSELAFLILSFWTAMTATLIVVELPIGHSESHQSLL